MFYVYILYSQSANKYYIGHTADINRRLEEHNNPSENTKFTAKHLPWELKLCFEISESRGDALRVERFIKNQKNREFIERLFHEKNNQKFLIELISNILIRG